MDRKMILNWTTSIDSEAQLLLTAAHTKKAVEEIDGQNIERFKARLQEIVCRFVKDARNGSVSIDTAISFMNDIKSAAENPT